MRIQATVFFLGWLLFLANPLAAEVLHSARDGFTVEHRITSGFSSARTWQTLIEVASWWSPEHTFSGDASELSLIPQPQGCFCEALPGGGGVVHGTVINVDPGRLLRLQTSLGPLQELAITGVLNFALSNAETGGTSIVVTYRASGYTQDGLTAWAAPVDRVIGEQVARLEQQLGQSGFSP